MNTFTFGTELDAGAFGSLACDVTVSTRIETHGDDDTPYRKADEVLAVVVRGMGERYVPCFHRSVPSWMVGKDILTLLLEHFVPRVLRKADEAIQDNDIEENNA